jgi:NAD(P)-dependent dehydrogenase (short-subunit alcohol dehydrogenase family)
MSKTAIIISISSDIGDAMARRWKSAGWEVFGTYRTKSDKVNSLTEAGGRLIECDLSDTDSVIKACDSLPEWDVLVLCPGTQDPVGLFAETDFEEWEGSIKVNLTSQLRIVHALLPKKKKDASVIFFAGGGANNAPTNYSAYIMSKIALTKMTELLDAEVVDAKFTIVGPGWVKTKIHESTLKAGERAGSNLTRTKEKLMGNECTPMEEVLDCCDWIVESPRNVVSGRNISVVFDAWGNKKLEEELKKDFNMYKLRRDGNNKSIKRGK